MQSCGLLEPQDCMPIVRISVMDELVCRCPVSDEIAVRSDVVCNGKYQNAYPDCEYG